MAKSNRSIIVFTRWFPYNKVLEQSFLLDELRILSNHFSNVYVVPKVIEGDKYEEEEKFRVVEDLAHQFKVIPFRLKLKTVLSISFLRQLIKIRFNRHKMKYTIAYRLSALVTNDWLTHFCRDKQKIVTYSFWLDETALAMTMNNSPNIIKKVSRCHNYDLYGNRQNMFYVPFQKEMVYALDNVLPDSFSGVEFLKELYPNANVEAAIMGTSDPMGLNTLSSDGILRVVSCAYMIPRKRVLLFAQALQELNKRFPSFQMHWTHVGEGDQFAEVKTLVQQLNESIRVDLKGKLTTEELHEMYGENNFDLFVNTSVREGTPVAVIEAISRGIPLMATAFGGGKEIVEEGAGILLSNDPEVEEIVQKIVGIRKEDLMNFSARSREIWERNYSSVKNYATFCQLLDQE